MANINLEKSLLVVMYPRDFKSFAYLYISIILMYDQLIKFENTNTISKQIWFTDWPTCKIHGVNILEIKDFKTYFLILPHKTLFNKVQLSSNNLILILNENLIAFRIDTVNCVKTEMR